MTCTLLVEASERITWIRVDKPAIDLVGLILGSIAATALLAAAALALGAALGIALIRYRRRQRTGRAPFIRLDIPDGDRSPTDDQN